MNLTSEVCILANVSIDTLLADGQEEFLALFTEAERNYCLAHKKGKIHLAARLAAKKAVYTLLGTPTEIQWNTIFVRNMASGAPQLLLTGGAAKYAHTLRIKRWHLSLTHTERYSAAFVIAEKCHQEQGYPCSQLADTPCNCTATERDELFA
jgi:holo-[acyl-carrier protein] synthase